MNFILENKKGLSLCIFIALFSFALQWLENEIFKIKVLDMLIIALLGGLLIKNTKFPMLGLFSTSDKAPKFVSKQLLEFAVILLGFNISFSSLRDNGIPLIILAISSVMICMIIVFILCKKIFKLDRDVSILIATGNAICGNSAVAAMASVIKSKSNHVAIAISFSAVIGLIQVILLPLITSFGTITNFQYGIIAGLSVYAVPQVAAASFAVSTESGLIATQVKLLRVLMLGPVILAVSLMTGNKVSKEESFFSKLTTYVPWFVIGFIMAGVIGSLNILPSDALEKINFATKFIFAISMAGIGLTVNIKDLRGSALKVSVAVIFASLLMITIALIGMNIYNL